MNTTYAEPAHRPLYARFLRFVVVGGFTLLLLYVKAVAAILKLGLKALKKVPVGDRKSDV